MQLSFGTGALWAERVDTTGNLIGPQQFGVLQDTTINFEFTEKELYGQNQYAVAIARGQAKVTGSCTSARLLGRVFSDIFFGETVATGQFGIAQAEVQTIPTTPYQVTVTNAATFAEDLGVYYQATGKPLDRVSSSPSTGQYSVNTGSGVYTFAAADTTLAVLISYHYTFTSSGKLITLNNHLQGYTPYFKATFYQSISPNPPPQTASSVPFGLRLNACHSNKLMLATKVDDWEIPQFDFGAFADTSGIVGYLSTVE